MREGWERVSEGREGKKVREGDERGEGKGRQEEERGSEGREGKGRRGRVKLISKHYYYK